ncbi:MAG: thiamine diphosphokinase [Ruminiclostridium sp.]|nr:thiamine diphosphokinase [Ruminiclostridium sp.]
MKTCIVFGAGTEFPERIMLPDGERIIIAADGGLERLNDLGITPDRVIGDLDSLGEAPVNISFTRLPHIKDTTDTFEAVKTGCEEGCTEFHIYGGTGGRLDHTIANIQLAAQLSQQGKTPFIYGSGYVITAVTDGTFSLPARESGYVSVFAHSDVCEGVTISGLFYEVENVTLRNDFALGVSNEYTGKPAEISVKHGTICVYYEV